MSRRVHWSADTPSGSSRRVGQLRARESAGTIERGSRTLL